ncbi:MAG: 50S ribosomal protein L9 [Patescibacteria group bacterium]
MKVILLENIENLGQKYEVKEVKDGYARNFLIPQKLVKIATKEAMIWLGSEREKLEKSAEEALNKAQAVATSLEGQEIVIAMKVGEEGQLFESVSPQKVAEELKALGFDIKKTQISIDQPIKELGEYQIKIKLDHNLETEVTVIVTVEE